MKQNKKIIYIFLIIILAVLAVLIYRKVIKNNKSGNNMSSQEIVDYILNIRSYKTNVTIQVNSNKNTNKYILNQEYNLEGQCVQEIVEPSNIAGIKIIKNDEKIIVENSNLSLTQIFENYKYLEENSLDLSAFIKNYRENERSYFEENEKEIIMKTKNENKNKYIENKILYINKENKKPTKLIIEDNNQNTTINIQYNMIELN